jgi:riboflavin kinase/FMN adenylyltransferase
MRAIVIGNFDGVHSGHRHLFRTALGRAREVVAVTFEPLPAAVLRPEIRMGRLTPSDERRALLIETCGAGEVLELEPTSELLGRSPAAFIDDLRDRIDFQLVVEGPDFRFGHRRSGDVDLLRSLGQTRGFEVSVAEPFEVILTDGSRVEARSSVARALLGEGRVADAACVFGRPYELRCRTAQGDQRGRTIGWPTANLDAIGRILPADGVYAGEATLPDGRVAIAAISVGTKPTFGESARTCETTLLEPDGRPLDLPLDWYGWPIRLRFHERIRGMERFGGLEALLAAMEGDRAAVLSTMRGPRAFR